MKCRVSIAHRFESPLPFDIQYSLFDIRHSPRLGISQPMLSEGVRPFQIVRMGFLPTQSHRRYHAK